MEGLIILILVACLAVLWVRNYGFKDIIGTVKEVDNSHGSTLIMFVDKPPLRLKGTFNVFQKGVKYDIWYTLNRKVISIIQYDQEVSQ